ncbi:hypothetical protein EWB00_009834 [Schistosoma japonicum]|uniref:Secreted protein n=1 Tax=Schistosoma japonicum TaxID=6182 RepID=A0A4Z2DQM4_SCHJA|nr:hypothetical protein KSF78_0005078 [Schistosoma japonicum]KAH8876912.1 hypothetical protein KSF78_0005078 [Schistosoma japonicum]TNN18824.1 hypothetical protein EWB00_009833 [Schistosoma japonicum]TNN18825.1 hypothetical protein EWB00_009834 [Schistosoma japonicum]
MIAIKALFICICLYTIIEQIEAAAKHHAKTRHGDEADKASKLHQKHQKPGKGKKAETEPVKATTDLPEGASREVKMTPEEGGILLDLLFGLI